MAKAIFTVRRNSNYDDLPEYRYHFPKKYLSRVKPLVNDWVVYYEPSRATADSKLRDGRQVYFAIAKVDSLESDPRLDDHYYTYVSDYLEFDRCVPFREGEHFYESKLQHPNGGPNAVAFMNAVRPISDNEYTHILHAGFKELIVGSPQHTREPRGTLEEKPRDFERKIIQQVVNRPFRDAAFSKQVKTAYKDTCAVTGLKIINGGGRAEVEAAHIRPVSDNGRDSVRNGIALCKTVHWMFDRGLISIDDDYTLLVKKGSIPDSMLAMFRPDRRLCVPLSTTVAPHPEYLQYHRDTIFKG